MTARYLFDTLIVAALLHRRPPAIALASPWIAAGQASTSILCYGEVEEYIQGRPDYQDLHQALQELLDGVRPYFLTYGVMERYARLRRAMRRQGPGLIGDVDSLIAATALEYDLTLVTTDTDFRRVPGLVVHLIHRPNLHSR